MSFPVLIAAHGDPIDVLPRRATPLTAVFVDGRLSDLQLGGLSRARMEALSAQLLGTVVSDAPAHLRTN